MEGKYSGSSIKGTKRKAEDLEPEVSEEEEQFSESEDDYEEEQSLGKAVVFRDIESFIAAYSKRVGVKGASPSHPAKVGEDSKAFPPPNKS